MFASRKLVYLPIIAVMAFFGLFAFYSPVHAEDSVPPVVDAPAETQPEAPAADNSAQPPAVESAPAEVSVPAEVSSEVPVESTVTSVVSVPEPQTPSTGVATKLQVKLGEETTSYYAPVIDEKQNPEVKMPVTIPQVVVLDQSGNSMPLVTEEAGEALKEPDPYFFIGTTKLAFTATDCDPGIAGNQACEPGIDPLQAAFNYISLRGLSPVGGAIYVEEGTYSSLEIYDTDWTSNFHAVPTTLSLIGVKTGLLIPDKTVGSSVDHIINGFIDVEGMKSFTLQAFSILSNADSYSIAYFAGNTGTLNLIDVEVVNSGAGDGLTITDHTGAINLNMVNSSGNGGDGAYVNNKCLWVWNGSSYDCTNLPSATVTIKNSSFNSNGTGGLTVLSNGTATLTGVSASNNIGYDGAYIRSKGLTINQSIFSNNGGSGLWVNAHDLGGATLVQNSQFNSNADMGIFIEQNGNVDVKNIRANDNGSNGLWVDTCRGNPCTNLFTGNVSIIQSEFGSNVKTATNPDPTWPFGGMVIQAKGTITLTDDFSGWNGNGTHPAYGARLVNPFGIFAVNITNSSFGSNNEDGLSVISKGTITLKDSSSIDNTGNGAYLDNDLTGATAGISILNTPDMVNLFSNNGSDGLEMYSRGAVLVTSVRADGNTESGIYVNNSNGSGIVTIDGARGTTANNNGENGIWVISKGMITVKNMDAGGNVQNGYKLDNQAGTGGVSILVTIPGWHNGLQNNGENGFSIFSNGAVIVQKTFANNNQHYGGYIDNSVGTANVTISDSDFNDNGNAATGGLPDYGLFVQSRGIIALTNINARNNGNDDPLDIDDVYAGGVWLDNSVSSIAKSITITKGFFNDNFGAGLDVVASGPVTYKNGQVNNNESGGISIDNTAISKQNVTVDTVNLWGNDKGFWGLNIQSAGNILVSATDVSGFDGDGVFLNNTAGTGTITISGTPTRGRYIGRNNGNGLTINTNGPVTISYLSINDNVGYGASIENSNSTAIVTISFSEFNSNGMYDLPGIDKFGLSVTAGGNITLDSVQVADNNDYGVKLDNRNGLGSVTIKSATGREIRSNAGNGLWVLSKGNIILTNISVHNNYLGFGAWLDNSFGTAGTVTINSTLYTGWQGNGDYGLQIDSPGAVTINLVDAYQNNGTNGDIDNHYALGTATPTVTITNSWFNESQNGSGLNVTSKGNISLTNVDANGNNPGHGAFLNNSVVGGKGTVIITGTSADDKRSFNNNADYGLLILSNGAITLKYMDASNNVNYGAVVNNSSATTPQPVSITEAAFNNNSYTGAGGYYGLRVYSKGNITGTRVFAQNNGNYDASVSGNGMLLDNCLLSGDYCTGSGTITLNGAGGYSNNGEGLIVKSFGAITLSDVGAGWNGGNGGTFANNFKKVNPNPLLPDIYSVAGVTLSLPAGLSTEWGIYRDNGGYGLDIKSNGAVSVAYVNVNNNGTSGNAAFIDNSTAVTPMSVTITKSKFNDNQNAIREILVNSKGAINFSNNEVKGNQGAYADDQGAAELDNHTSSAPQNVTVTFSTFGNNNGGDGLLVLTKGNALLTNMTAYGNADDGIDVIATFGNGTITLNGTRNSLNGNIDNGVEFLANGNVIVTNITAEYNSGDGLAIITSGIPGLATSGTVTVTNANLNRNAYNGIWASSNGLLTLTNVTGLGNGTGPIAGMKTFDGAHLTTNAKDIIITNSVFSGNGGSGIWSDTGIANWLKLIGSFFYGNSMRGSGYPNLDWTGYLSII